MEYQEPGDNNTEGLQVFNKCIKSVWESRLGDFFFFHSPRGKQSPQWPPVRIYAKESFLEDRSNKELSMGTQPAWGLPHSLNRGMVQ